MVQLNKEWIQSIEVLTQLVNIAIIDENVFVYYSFEGSSASNTSSIDFCSIQCICVTDFFTMNHIDPASQNIKSFLARFQSYIENRVQLTMKFNKTTPYFLFNR
jgi:hypothetical protein